MNLKIYEKTGDLFDYQDTHHLAHCIASDFGMLGGIAKQFVDKLDMREKLRKWSAHQHTFVQTNFHSYYPPRPKLVGTAVLIDNTFNLITKISTSNLPTYENLYDSLEDMRNQVERLGIKRLAMPRIGCGIDGLDWEIVYDMVVAIFKELDIEIIVVNLPQDSDRGDIHDDLE